MGTLSDYTLLALRSDVLREFGLDAADTQSVSMVTDQINKAQQWLLQYKESRYWAQKRLVLTVQAPLTGFDADFTNGSTELLNPNSITGINVGDVLVPTGADPETGGYLIVDLLTTPSVKIVLDAGYLGATKVNQTFSVYKPYIKLPDDFASLWSIRDVKSIRTKLYYVTPDEYENKLWDSIGPIGATRYTIMNPPIDPADTASANRYLALLPFPSEATILRGIYYRTVRDLVDDGDVPLVPRTHRLVLLYTAQWFVAVHLKRSQDIVNDYKEMAALAQQNLNKRYEPAEPMDREDRVTDVLDLATDDDILRASFDFPIE